MEKIIYPKKDSGEEIEVIAQKLGKFTDEEINRLQAYVGSQYTREKNLDSIIASKDASILNSDTYREDLFDLLYFVRSFDGELYRIFEADENRAKGETLKQFPYKMALERGVNSDRDRLIGILESPEEDKRPKKTRESSGGESAQDAPEKDVQQ